MCSYTQNNFGTHELNTAYIFILNSVELHGHQLTRGPNVSVSYTPLLIKPTSRVATAAAAMVAAVVHHCRSRRCSAPPTSNSHRRRRLPSDLAHAPALFAGPSEGGEVKTGSIPNRGYGC